MKSIVSLKTFSTKEAVLTCVKKILDNLSLPSQDSNDDPSTDSNDNKRTSICLIPISLLLFELETETNEGWNNVHETIKQMYAKKRE